MIRARSNIERLRGDAPKPSLSSLCQECGELRQLNHQWGGCLCYAFTDRGSKLQGARFVAAKGNKSQRRKKRKASQAATRLQRKPLMPKKPVKKVVEVICYEPTSIQW